METQEIEIVIDKNGQVHLQVRGAKGEACLEITAGVEEALGGIIASREMTPEAQETSTVQLPEVDRLKSSRKK